MAKKLPAAVAKKLGWYVYLYVDPVTGEVLYVGKGRGSRALAHLESTKDKPLTVAIERLRKQKLKPRIEILAHDLSSEKTALRVEAAAIDLLGIGRLANQVRGHSNGKPRRMLLDDLVAHYTRKKATIVEPSILIRINRLFRYGMSPVELYDATRSAWVVAEKRREQVELAFAVYQGVIREVYRVQAWLPYGTTFALRCEGRAGTNEGLEGRWEFVGIIAEDSVRERYLNRYVGDQLKQGARNPISYAGFDD